MKIDDIGFLDIALHFYITSSYTTRAKSIMTVKLLFILPHIQERQRGLLRLSCYLYHLLQEGKRKSYDV